MAEPVGPASLFKLACDSMLKAAKNGKFKSKLDLQLVPRTVWQTIWDHSSLMEIISLSSAMELSEFFVPIARRRADDIAVHIEPRHERSHELQIICTGKAMLMWEIKSGNPLYNNPSTDFMLHIEKGHYQTRMVFESAGVETFVSFTQNHDVSEAINWLSHLFQTNIN